MIRMDIINLRNMGVHRDWDFTGELVGCNSEAYYTVSARFHAAQYASLLTPYEKIAPYRVHNTRCINEAYYTVATRLHTAQYVSLLTPYEKIAPYRVAHLKQSIIYLFELIFCVGTKAVPTLHGY
jgi:hypothetical protein